MIKREERRGSKTVGERSKTKMKDKHTKTDEIYNVYTLYYNVKRCPF